MRLNSLPLDQRTIDGRLNASAPQQDLNGGTRPEPGFDGLLADLDTKGSQTSSAASTPNTTGAAGNGQKASATDAIQGKVDVRQGIKSGGDAATSTPAALGSRQDPAAFLSDLMKGLTSQRTAAAISPRAGAANPADPNETGNSLVATKGIDRPTLAPDRRSDNKLGKASDDKAKKMAERQDDRAQSLSPATVMSPPSAASALGTVSMPIPGLTTGTTSLSAQNPHPPAAKLAKQIASPTSSGSPDQGDRRAPLEQSVSAAAEAPETDVDHLIASSAVSAKKMEFGRSVSPDGGIQRVGALSAGDPSAVAALVTAHMSSMPTTTAKIIPDSGAPTVPSEIAGGSMIGDSLVAQVPSALPAVLPGRRSIDTSLKTLPDVTAPTGTNQPFADTPPRTGFLVAPATTATSPEGAPFITDVVVTTELAPVRQDGFAGRFLSQTSANANDTAANPDRFKANGSDEASAMRSGQSHGSQSVDSAATALAPENLADGPVPPAAVTTTVLDEKYASRKNAPEELSSPPSKLQAGKSFQFDPQGAPASISFPTRAIVENVVALASSSTASPVPDVSGSAITTPARTMTLQLSQADLGTIGVRIHLSGQSLDLQLSVSDKHVIGVIDRERDALADALRDQNFDVRSLVIQGSDASLPSGDSNAAARNDSGGGSAQGSGQNAAGSQSRDGGRQSAPPSRDPGSQRGPASDADSAPSNALFV